MPGKPGMKEASLRFRPNRERPPLPTMTAPMRPDDSWYEDPRTLASRTHAVLAAIERHRGGACKACGARICGHATIFSFILGHGEAPLCAPCLARAADRPVEILSMELAAFAASKECLSMGMRRAGQIEASPPGAAPCPRRWFAGADAGRGSPAPPAAPEAPPAGEPDACWDAGELGCGELALELRRRLESCAPGSRFLLVTRDAGASEDVPAWCRLTGHALLGADPPRFLIRRKE